MESFRAIKLVSELLPTVTLTREYGRTNQGRRGWGADVNDNSLKIVRQKIGGPAAGIADPYFTVDTPRGLLRFHGRQDELCHRRVQHHVQARSKSQNVRALARDSDTFR